MNEVQSSSSSDDPLDRAEDALRRTRMPNGPSEETITRTLAALSAAANEPVVNHFLRRRLMLTAMKFAAVASLAAGGLFYLTGAPPAGATAAFGQVAQKLRDSATLSCRLAIHLPGRKDPVTTRLFFKKPGLLRVESVLAEGHVTITDQIQGESLAFDPASKTFRLEKLKNYGLPTNWAERMRKQGEKQGVAVGRKQVGEIQAQGFRVKDDDGEATVWVDPNSRRLLRVEFEESGRARGQNEPIRVGYILTDIDLDPKLEGILFSTKPPDGYTQVENTRQPLEPWKR